MNTPLTGHDVRRHIENLADEIRTHLDRQRFTEARETLHTALAGAELSVAVLVDDSPT